MSSAAHIPLPTPAYLANCRWIEQQLDQLVHAYPDQWIAVDGGRVLAAGPDLERVSGEAHRLGASPDAAFEFIAGASLVF